MAEEIGGISYTVGADTRPLANSGKVVDKITDQMVLDFEKVEQTVDETTQSLIDMRREVSTSAKKTSDALSRTGKAANDAGDKTKNFRSIVGQAGFQIQDFAVQLEGGTSFLRAFGQQGSQLAGAFGPTGAVVGAIIAVATALGSALLPSLFKSGDGIEELTKKLKELVKTSTLTAAQSQVLIDAEKKSLKERLKRIAELEKEISVEQLRISRQKEAIKNYDEESKVFINLTNAIKKSEKALAPLRAEQELLNSEVKKANDNIKLYTDLTGNRSTTATKKQTDAVKDLIKGLKEEADTYGLTGRELALRIADTNKATAADRRSINAIFDRIDALKQEEEAQKARNRLQTQVQGAARGLLDPSEQLKLQLQTDLELFKAAEAEKVLTEQQSLELRRRAQERYAKGVQALNNQAVSAQRLLANIGTNFANQVGSSLAGVISGAQDGEQAIRSLAQAILTQAIQALIQLGIQSTIGQAAAVASNAASATALSAAYATPAALASLASFGANAAPANAAVAGTIASTKALAAAGRQYGGPVSAGSVYQVGERNRPEVLTESGKSYLLPGNRGSVTPAGGAGGPEVVNNFTFVTEPGIAITPGNETANETGGVDREFVVRILDAQLANQGSSTSNIIKNNYSLTSRLGGQRRT